MYISKRTIKKFITIAVALIAGGGLFLLGFSYALAQTGEDGPDQPAQVILPAPEAQPVLEAPAGQINGMDPSDYALSNGDAPSALVIAAIPIQGRLTDSAGLPIHGTRTIIMSLYDAFTGGTARCQDTDLVSVVNGLFSTNMDFCTPGNIDGTQLYLGIQVQGEASEMTPRQPIYITPYAFSLVDGAHIGALVSSADTEITVSPQKMVQAGASNLAIQPLSFGSVQLDALSIGTHYAYLPVDLPTNQYGSDYRLKSLYYCYDLNNAANFITEVDARYVDTAGNGMDIITDLTNRTSTTWSCATINDATPVVINGSMFIRFELVFANTIDVIQIGIVRLTLTQQ